MVARRALRRCLHRVIRRCTPRSFGVISAILVAGLGLTAGLALAQSIRTRTIADAVRSAEV